jgi:hypothetical protein
MNDEQNPYESPQVVDAAQKENIPADAIPVAPDSVAFGREVAWFAILLVIFVFATAFIDDRLYRCFLVATLVQLFILFIIGLRVLAFFRKMTVVDSILIRFGVIPITALFWFLKAIPGF